MPTNSLLPHLLSLLFAFPPNSHTCIYPVCLPMEKNDLPQAGFLMVMGGPALSLITCPTTLPLGPHSPTCLCMCMCMCVTCLHGWQDTSFTCIAVRGGPLCLAHPASCLLLTLCPSTTVSSACSAAAMPGDPDQGEQGDRDGNRKGQGLATPLPALYSSPAPFSLGRQAMPFALPPALPAPCHTSLQHLALALGRNTHLASATVTTYIALFL